MSLQFVRISALLFFSVFSLVAHSFGAEQQRFDVAIGNSLQRGPATAPVTLIEFLDFQ